MKARQAALVFWLVTPLIAVAVLCVLIASWWGSRERMREMNPPVGAGSNDTGGANAIGEMLAGNDASHGRRPDAPQPEPEAPPAPKADPKIEPAAPAPRPRVQPLGQVKRITVKGGVGVPAEATRDLLVWLPPEYTASGTTTYPVLYLLDGAAAFEPVGSAPSWRASEAATDLLSRHSIADVIIVGVPAVSDGVEFAIEPPPQGNTPNAALTLDWLRGTVMPAVAQAARVRSGPDTTAIGGGGHAGLAALWMALRAPEAFGLVLVESPALPPADAPAYAGMLSTTKTWPGRVYLGVGGQEGADSAQSASVVARVVALDTQLKQAGLGPARRVLVIDSSAHGGPDAWAARLPQALGFLFPPGGERNK